MKKTKQVSTKRSRAMKLSWKARRAKARAEEAEKQKKARQAEWNRNRTAVQAAPVKETRRELES